MDLMLRKAETALSVGMERAGFAAPGSKEAVKHFVGERIVEGRLPNNCATVKAVLIPLRSRLCKPKKTRLGYFYQYLNF